MMLLDAIIVHCSVVPNQQYVAGSHFMLMVGDTQLKVKLLVEENDGKTGLDLKTNERPIQYT